MRTFLAEYIWLDGARPTQQLRSKTRVVPHGIDRIPDLSSFPEWSFDGSSTNQSDGGDSDLILKPVRFVRDSLRQSESYLVLCEVFDGGGEPHTTNTRAGLRRALEEGGAAEQPWVGFEQEYTLFDAERPLGWPQQGFPAPQGPFYCGVGTGRVHGRDLVEQHAQACLEAGLMLYGTNAEVMPGQWEFQIGYRGIDSESADPLTVADHLLIARWLLHRVSESHGVTASFEPKPIKGDWNGAGNHTNFSTRAMREPGGLEVIHSAIRCLAANHERHVADYGHALGERLTGLHETCNIDEFRAGVANRGASIRIPRQVEEQGSGYFEDRRPGANCDPYLVCTRLIETVCLAKPLQSATR